MDALFDILTVEDADTLQELVKSWLHNAGELLKTLRDVDEETAEMMRRTLKLLAQNMGRSAQNLLLQEPAEKMQPLKKRTAGAKFGEASLVQIAGTFPEGGEARARG